MLRHSSQQYLLGKPASEKQIALRSILGMLYPVCLKWNSLVDDVIAHKYLSVADSGEGLGEHIRAYLRQSRGLDGHLRTHHYINYVNPNLELVPMFTLNRPRYLGYRAGLLRKKSSRSSYITSIQK